MKLNELMRELKRMPLTSGLGEQIEILQSRYGNEYVYIAEEILRLFELLNLDAIKVSRIYIYDYLKQLNFFIEHRNYGHGDFAEIRNDIYDNGKVMLETYLPGLLLSYVYTTILWAKNHLFLNSFLPRINEKMHGIEIGFGEGFYLWEIFKHYPQIEIVGFDISSYAIQFSKNLLKAANVSSKKYHLQYGNIFEGISHSDESADFGVLAELVEHIPKPETGVQEVVKKLKKGGFLYLTTVINSNHMDHITNFESPAVVERLLVQCGLKILATHTYYMTDDFPNSKDISVGLAFVAEKL